MPDTVKDIGVAHIIDTLDPGGSEQMAVNIANGLARQGVRTCLIVSRKGGLLQSKVDGNVPVHILNKKSATDYKAFNNLCRYLKINKIGIIHAHSSSVIWATMAKVRLGHIKIIWHDHYGKSEELQSRKGLGYKLCSWLWAYVVTVNDNLTAWGAENLFINRNRISLLHNFATAAPIEKVPGLERLNVRDFVNIVCVANLRPQKDHANLLGAFALLAAKHDKVLLHLVGVNPGDSYAAGVLQLIQEHEYAGRIHYWGTQMKISSWLAYMDIGVLSSQSEGLPVSLLEYGLAGLRVVATSVGQVSGVLDNGRMGYLVPPGQKEQLAAAMAEAIAGAPEKAKLFQNHVAAHYSEQAIILQLIDIYKLGIEKN